MALPLSDFEAYLRSQHRLQPSTIKSYAAMVRRIARSGLRPADWLASMVDGETPTGTLRHRTAAAQRYYDWLEDRGVGKLGRRPGSARRNRERPQPIRQAVLLDDEQLQTYKAVLNDAFILPAVRTILLLLPETGMRPSEACRIEIPKMGRHPTVTAYGVEVSTRNGASRWVALGTGARDVLRVYLAKYRPIGAFLFPTRPGLPEVTAPRTIYHALKELRGDLGPWAEGLVPDDLRQTFAERLRRTGAPEGTIRALLGLSSKGKRVPSLSEQLSALRKLRG